MTAHHSLGDTEHPWRTASAVSVRARIAQTALGSAPPDEPPLGDIALHQHQQDAVARIRDALRQFGGALLADEVGLGKTFVALSLARTYPQVVILAPAALLPMWRNAVRTARASNARINSLHALSSRRWTAPRTNPDALIVVDEAHHLRTRTTRRYRNAAQVAAGHDVLLLSATPLHNRPRELRQLLALFLGDRADALDADSLAILVVRRTHDQVHASATLPDVIEHAEHAVPENTPVLEALLALPPPLPTRDGSAAGALVRLGLLRAWCSSDAALSDSIRRRRLRGEALLHALSHGRHPSRLELRTWITGADSVQLGFVELLVGSACTSSRPLLATLTRHLTALGALEQLHTRTAIADPVRGELLRRLLKDSDPTPIIAFSQFASTVRALHRALADVAGVASLTSNGGRVAGGPMTRHEIIARFAPRAHERPPPAAHEAIRLLITTDLLSEGVNLQDAGRLVHVDFPWTDAARAQRVGRIARLGSEHRIVHVYAVAPPPGGERTLQLVATLERKARVSVSLVGRSSRTRNAAQAADAEEQSAPDAATRLREVLLDWRARLHAGSRPSESRNRTTLVAGVPAHAAGWIAAVRYAGRSALMAQLHGASGPGSDVVGVTALDVLKVVGEIAGERAQRIERGTFEARVADVFQRVGVWYETQVVGDLTGPSSRVVATVRRQLLERVGSIVSACMAARRGAFSRQVTEANAVIINARGVGAEFELERWREMAELRDPGEWLVAWREFPALARVGSAVMGASGHRDELQVTAMLLLTRVAE